jgi:hypothetical protein
MFQWLDLCDDLCDDDDFFDLCEPADDALRRTTAARRRRQTVAAHRRRRRRRLRRRSTSTELAAPASTACAARAGRRRRLAADLLRLGAAGLGVDDFAVGSPARQRRRRRRLSTTTTTISCAPCAPSSPSCLLISCSPPSCRPWRSTTTTWTWTTSACCCCSTISSCSCARDGRAPCGFFTSSGCSSRTTTPTLDVSANWFHAAGAAAAGGRRRPRGRLRLQLGVGVLPLASVLLGGGLGGLETALVGRLLLARRDVVDERRHDLVAARRVLENERMVEQHVGCRPRLGILGQTVAGEHGARRVAHAARRRPSRRDASK